MLEDIPLFIGAEAKQDVRIFAYRQVRQQDDFFTEAGQVVEGAHRHIDFIPDAVAIDQQLRRIFFEQYSGKTTYHLSVTLGN
ncbi:hypothetical protein D3C81_1664200 [compost metagenome]